MIRKTRPERPLQRRVFQFARFGTAATFIASLYLLLATHPVGSGLAPDWVGHLVLFAALGGGTGLLVTTTETKAPLRTLAIGLIAVTVYGPITEVAQGFTGRDPQLSDALTDIASAVPAFAIGYAVWAVLSPVRREVP